MQVDANMKVEAASELLPEQVTDIVLYVLRSD